MDKEMTGMTNEEMFMAIMRRMDAVETGITNLTDRMDAVATSIVKLAVWPTFLLPSKLINDKIELYFIKFYR